MGHGTQARVSRLALLVVGLAAGPSAVAGEWIRLYGTAELERAGSVAATSDGGYVMAGWSSPGSASLISKVDAEGLPQWQRSFRGITSPARVLQARDGSLVVVGGARMGNRHDAALIRIDANGTLMGQVRLGDASSDAFTDVLELGNGRFLAVGVRERRVSGAGVPWVVELNLSDATSAAVAWQRTYVTEGDARGYPGPTQVAGVVPAHGGGYLLFGTATYYSCGDLHGCEGPWLAKITPTGGLVWARTYGYGARVDGPFLMSVKPASLTSLLPTPDGGYLGVGWDRLPTRLLLLRFDSSGSLTWQRAYLGGGANGLAAVPGGGYVVAGSLHKPEDPNHLSVPWLVRLGSGGDVLWEYQFQAEGEGTGVAAVDQRFVLAGWQRGGGSGYDDMLLAKVQAPVPTRPCFSGQRPHAVAVPTHMTEWPLGVTEAPGTAGFLPSNHFLDATSSALTSVSCGWAGRPPRPTIGTGPLRHCLDLAQLPFGKPHSGSDRSARCSPGSCPACAYRLSVLDPIRPAPEWSDPLYEKVGLRLTSPPAPWQATVSARALRAAWADGPLATCLAELVGDAADSGGAARLDEDLSGCLNESEVEALMPRTLTREVQAGRQDVDLGGIARLSLTARTNGTLGITVKAATARLPPDYVGSWPFVAYSIEFDPGLVDGPVDLRLFVGGLALTPDPSALRILALNEGRIQPLETKAQDGGRVLLARIRGPRTLLVASLVETASK